METLKVKFKLNGLEFELEGNEATVQEELKIFKDFVMNSLIHKITNDNSVQTLRVLGIGAAEAAVNDQSSFPPLKEIVMKDLPKSEVEWICIYSFYASEFKQVAFKDSDIKGLYESSKRKNDSRMANFSGNFGKVVNNGWIKVLNNQEYLMTTSGYDEAIKIIGRNIENSTDAATGSQKGKKGKSKNTVKATFSLVNSLNLNPPNSKSLKEFFAEFQSKTFFEKNLLFLYYLEKLLKTDSISINHIYTCYKNAGEKVPGNLYQSLVDTKNYKGWIESKDINNLKITIAGENYVEHDFQKTEKK